MASIMGKNETGASVEVEVTGVTTTADGMRIVTLADAGPDEMSRDWRPRSGGRGREVPADPHAVGIIAEHHAAVAAGHVAAPRAIAHGGRTHHAPDPLPLVTHVPLAGTVVTFSNDTPGDAEAQAELHRARVRAMRHRAAGIVVHRHDAPGDRTVTTVRRDTTHGRAEVIRATDNARSLRHRADTARRSARLAAATVALAAHETATPKGWNPEGTATGPAWAWPLATLEAAARVLHEGDKAGDKARMARYMADPVKAAAKRERDRIRARERRAAAKAAKAAAAA